MKWWLAIVLCAACSTAAERPRPLAAAADGGAAKDAGALASTDGAAPRVDAAGPAQPDLAGVYQVVCGSVSCDLTADQICCLQAGSATPACTGSGGCAFFGHAITCDESADCAGTKICCGTVDPYTSGSCTVGTTCPGSLVRLCRSSSQCPADVPKCCASQNAWAYSCMANPPANYDCL
jgi:hypothetical protein